MVSNTTLVYLDLLHDFPERVHCSNVTQPQDNFVKTLSFPIIRIFLKLAPFIPSNISIRTRFHLNLMTLMNNAFCRPL